MMLAAVVSLCACNVRSSESAAAADTQRIRPPQAYSPYDDLSPEAVTAASLLFVEGVATNSGADEGGIYPKYTVKVKRILFAAKRVPSTSTLNVVGDYTLGIPAARAVSLALLPVGIAANHDESYRLTWRVTSIGELDGSQIVFRTVRGVTIRHAQAGTDPIGCFFAVAEKAACRKQLLARFGVTSARELVTFDAASERDPATNLTWMLVYAHDRARYPSIVCGERDTSRLCASRDNFTKRAHLHIVL